MGVWLAGTFIAVTMVVEAWMFRLCVRLEKSNGWRSEKFRHL